MDKNDVVILSFARTPIGDFQGALKDIPLVDLTAAAGKAAMERAGVKPEEIEEVAMGCGYKHGNKGNPARQVQLGLGIPETGWAYTLDQQCASGMKALDTIYRSLKTGGCKVGLALGGESMSRVPYMSLNARMGLRMGDAQLVDTLTHDGLVCAIENYHMGLTAENLAEEYNISREEQDELAVISNQRAAAAIADGKFKAEIVPVTIETRKGTVVVETDEHPRADVSVEKLGNLRTAFKKDGTVTAGNASSINDGAAALVLTTAGYAQEHGLRPIARVLSTVSMGAAPRVMGIGPVYAIPKAIKEAGLTEADIDYYEINEAFAAQFIACNRVLNISMDKVNANGSGVGLGHPVGCTGARIAGAVVYELERRNQRYGVASLCVGGGPAMAVVLEKL